MAVHRRSDRDDRPCGHGACQRRGGARDKLYSIEMSDGFLPANGKPFRWINPAGGDFAEAVNWRTFDGPTVPQEDADIEFVALRAAERLPSLSMGRARWPG